MFTQKQPQPGAASKGSAITTVISAIGTALGIGAAVLFTPAFYRWTRPAMMEHFLETWSPDVAEAMTWIMAGVEAFLIYGFTRLVFTLLTVLGTAAFAARGFPGTRA